MVQSLPFHRGVKTTYRFVFNPNVHKKEKHNMTTLAPTLSNRFLPHAAGWLRDVILIVLGALFVAVLAQIEIPLPFTPVPITGQTFGVLLVGAALGSKRGAASLASYLSMGIVGLPFFAGGAHGLDILIGATGGYLIGFVVAAYVIGLLAERGLERSMRTSMIPFLIERSLSMCVSRLANRVSRKLRQRAGAGLLLPGRRCDQISGGLIGVACGVEVSSIVL
jgi:biotin transporter BioY